RLYSRKLTLGSSLLEIEPKQASALLASRHDTVPVRAGGPGRPTRATKVKGMVVGLLPSGRTFHKYLSEFADWDDQPLFKSFLRRARPAVCQELPPPRRHRRRRADPLLRGQRVPRPGAQPSRRGRLHH